MGTALIVGTTDKNSDGLSVRIFKMHAVYQLKRDGIIAQLGEVA